MRHLILLAGLGLASLSHAGTNAIKYELGTNCIIDGSFTPRCFSPKSKFNGVSYPVYTSDNPKDVLDEAEAYWNRNDLEGTRSPYLPRSQDPRTKVMIVPMPIGEDYPDVICLGLGPVTLKSVLTQWS